MKKRKTPIRFRSEKEEFEFWSKADSTDYVDRATLVKAHFPELRPTSRPIPLRLPIALIDRLKVLAHKMDMPYHSLMRRWIEQGLRRDSR
ncbi:MAG: BrnA antitoxin family protein [Elusimicrobia bacterium]|nr:BrnA antitoxin family protein [Elusimicrobiota bacterium]